MKERAIISFTALTASLLAYYYAKGHGKDRIPYMLVAGFAGVLAGEFIAAKYISMTQEKL